MLNCLQVNVDEFPPPNTVTPYPEATSITVGDEYYVLSKWLPAGASQYALFHYT